MSAIPSTGAQWRGLPTGACIAAARRSTGLPQVFETQGAIALIMNLGKGIGSSVE
ncbi:hypothetical protein AMST5_03873 [freshwater sediment metagenome]|uniref:Uncharacterized protein n=1 Tax=freshwater sediment metagenome TaxID=556182 RepID=A0AA48M3W7_9ZZZZ